MVLRAGLSISNSLRLSVFINNNLLGGTTQFNQGIPNTADDLLYFGTSGFGDQFPNYVIGTKWHTSAGVKTITEIQTREVFLEIEDVSKREFVVYSRSGTVYTEVAARDLGVPDNPATVSYTIDLSSDPLIVTIPDSFDDILMCMRYERPTTGNGGTGANTGGRGSGNSRPGIRGVNLGLLTSGETFRIAIAAAYTGTVDSLDSTDPNIIVANSDAAILFQITYTNDNKFFETEISSPHSGSGTNTYLIPLALGAQTSIKLEDVAATDTNNLTVAIGGDDWTGNTFNTEETIIHDMGDTTGGVNVITMNSNNVTLPDFDDGTNTISQDGDNFDYLIQQRGTTGDLFFLNKTTGMGPVQVTNNDRRDITTISHAVANAGARGSSYTFTNGNAIRFTGAGTVGNLQVGQVPTILIGDSQTGGKSSDTSDAVFVALGSGFRDNTTIKHMVWNAAIAGNRVTASSPGSTDMRKRFKSDTPGTADIVDMSDYKILFMGGGINDVVALVSDEGTSETQPAVIASAANDILSEAQTDGNMVGVLGLPPYSAEDDPAQDEWESIAARLLNTELVNLGYAFYNPFNDMWDGTTNASNMFVFNPLYTVDGGTHYNTTGANIVINNSQPVIAVDLD